MEQATIPVEDIDAFVKHLTQWHQSRVVSLKHWLDAPEGVVFTIGEDRKVVLDGTNREAFIMGVELSLMHLGELPFVAETDHGLPS